MQQKQRFLLENLASQSASQPASQPASQGVGYIKVLALLLWFGNLPGLGCAFRVSVSCIFVIWVSYGSLVVAFRIVFCLGVSLLGFGNVMVSRLCVFVCMRMFRKSIHVIWMCVPLWQLNMLVSFLKRGIGITWNSKRIIFFNVGV